MTQTATPRIAECQDAGRAHLGDQLRDSKGRIVRCFYGRVGKIQEPGFDAEQFARNPARLGAAFDDFFSAHRSERFGHLPTRHPAKHDAVPTSPLSEHRGDRAYFVVGVGQHNQKRLLMSASVCLQLTPDM